MNSTHKRDFGAFLADTRRTAGLTQKDLAARIFVTESAVSKWERGLSAPDITTLGPLARALGVTEGELVTARTDDLARLDSVQAATFRTWRASVLWTSIGVYAAALVTCFVVNLSVTHELTWFWIVASAVALGFSLTTLPLIVTGRRGWSTLAAALAALGVLLASIQTIVGGTFFNVSAASVLFGVVVVWGPIAIRAFASARLRRHNALVSVLIDSLALMALLLVVLGSAGRLAAFGATAVPLVCAASLVAVTLVVVVRYLPVPPALRASIACIVGAVVSLAAGPFVDTVIDRVPFALTPLHLSAWSPETINGNVVSLLALSFIAAAILLAVLSVRRRVIAPD